MWQPQSRFLVLALSLICLVASSLPPCTLASGGGKPLVTPITKDASTSLYTAPLKDGRPLLLDLSGPLIWSTCDADHPTLQTGERECTEASMYTRPDCWAHSDSGNYAGGLCAAHPYNPVTGRCASGDLTRATLCLPSGGGGQGVAIFGGGPLFLLPPWLQAVTSIMMNTTLRRYQDSPGYHIWIKSIDVNQARCRGAATTPPRSSWASPRRPRTRRSGPTCTARSCGRSATPRPGSAWPASLPWRRSSCATTAARWGRPAAATWCRRSTWSWRTAPGTGCSAPTRWHRWATPRRASRSWRWTTRSSGTSSTGSRRRRW